MLPVSSANDINQLQEHVRQNVRVIRRDKGAAVAKESNQRGAIEENLQGRINKARISHVMKTNWRTGVQVLQRWLHLNIFTVVIQQLGSLLQHRRGRNVIVTFVAPNLQTGTIQGQRMSRLRLANKEIHSWKSFYFKMFQGMSSGTSATTKLSTVPLKKPFSRQNKPSKRTVKQMYTGCASGLVQSGQLFFRAF